MTKAEMITEVLNKSKLGLSKKDAETFIDSFFGCAVEQIKKTGEFRVSDFGTFKLKNRAARMGRNPITGASLKIKASKTISFKPAKTLKEKL